MKKYFQNHRHELIIFVQHISKHTFPSQLHDFINPELTGLLPFRSGRVLKAEILALRDKRTLRVEYHGLVYVDSEAAGQVAIRRLNKKSLNNKVVSVREYVQRSWQNDRRQEHAKVVDLNGGRKDRRRGNNLETIKDISSLLSSNMSKSYKIA